MSLNFGNNGVSPVGANAVAAMVAVTGSLTSIDLSGNQMCGVWTDDYGHTLRTAIHGTYTAEGITAIADALRVNGSLTSINLSENFTNYGSDMTGIKELAAALGVNGSLTEVR